MNHLLEYNQDNVQPERPANQLGRFKFWARRYWWIMAVTIMLGLIAIDCLYLFETPQYTSQARMMVSGRVALPQGELYNGAIDLTTFYGTQVALMKSPQMAMQAIDRVSTLHPEVPVDKDAEAEAFVELRTSIFDLKVTSTSQDYAKLLLDAIMDTYLSSKREWKLQTTDEAVSAITEEISHLDAQIRDDGQQLLDFQKTNNVVFIEEQSSSAASYLVSLNNDLARLTKAHDLLTLESNDPLLKKNENESAGENTHAPDPDPAIQSVLSDKNAGGGNDPILSQQDYLEKLKILRDQLGLYLKDAHPKMKDLADSIDREQKLIDTLKERSKTARETYREELQLQIKNLEAQRDVWNAKSLELSQRLATFQDLKSKITREQNLYNQLSASIQNVDLNKSMDQSDVVILEAASPGKKVVHNYFLRLLIGVVGGIVVGLAIIFCLIQLDDKINSPLDIEQNMDFPLIGEIPLVPLDKKSKRVPLVSEDDARHEFVEHHRDIRSNILFGRSQLASNRCLMITSAAPGEGKSTLAANLAATFAFSGIRVLLIDGDLRKGILHNTFDLPVGPGLSDYLQTEAQWNELVQKTNILNLDIMTRGEVRRGAGDLLLGSIVDSLIQEAALEYDIVLWDTAPLFAAHDAANLCSRVDGVIFLARVRHTPMNLVRAALDDLTQRNAKIFGIVLNAVKSGQPGYYHKYRYREYSNTAIVKT